MDFTTLSNGSTVMLLMTLFLGVCLVGTAAMILVLLIKGDERKQMLVSKAAFVAVIGAVICLLLGFVYSTFIVPHVNVEVELHPIMYLGVISIVFDAAYLHYKRKYGA